MSRCTLGWASVQRCPPNATNPKPVARQDRHRLMQDGLAMHDRYGRVYLLPAVLAFVGPAFLVVATRGSFWPLAVGWWIGSLVVGSIKRRGIRIGVTIALLPICVLTAFEGGFFMLPAALALLAIDAANPASTPSKRMPQHSSH
jgi:hypothetical protein